MHCAWCLAVWAPPLEDLNHLCIFAALQVVPRLQASNPRQASTLETNHEAFELVQWIRAAGGRCEGLHIAVQESLGQTLVASQVDPHLPFFILVTLSLSLFLKYLLPLLLLRLTHAMYKCHQTSTHSLGM